MVNTCWCQNVSERSVCATCGCCKQNVVATMKGLIFYKNAYGKFCLGSRAVNLLIVKKLWGVRHKFWRLDAIEKLQKQNLIICILFAHPLYGDPNRCKWRLAVRILIADWWPLLTLGCSETMGHKSGPWSALTRRQYTRPTIRDAVDRAKLWTFTQHLLNPPQTPHKFWTNIMKSV